MASEPTTAETPQIVEGEVIPPPDAKKVPAMEAIERRATTFTEAGIQIATMADAMTWAKAVIDSELAPSGFERPSQVIVAVQTGCELGLGPAASLRAFYMTPQGRAALYAESALALCIKSGKLLKHYHVYTGEGDSLTCTFYVLRRGESDYAHESFSVREAKLAGLVKPNSNWEKWPRRMVLARSRAFVLHDKFADVLLGCPVEGDLDDIEPRDVPKPPAPPNPPTKQPSGFGLLDKAMGKKADAPVPEPPPEPKPEQPGCTHEPVKAYVKQYQTKLSTRLVCEACGLLVQHLPEGLRVLEEPPPAKKDPEKSGALFE